MKTLKDYINESSDSREVTESSVKYHFYRECYFDSDGDDDAVAALEEAIDEANKMSRGKAEAEIDEYDDTVLFSIFGRTEKDVEDYSPRLHDAIDPQYEDMIDDFSGDIVEQ